MKPAARLRPSGTLRSTSTSTCWATTARRARKATRSTRSSRSTTKASAACGSTRPSPPRSSRSTVWPMPSRRTPATRSAPTGSGPGRWPSRPVRRTLKRLRRPSSSGPLRRTTSRPWPPTPTSAGVQRSDRSACSSTYAYCLSSRPPRPSPPPKWPRSKAPRLEATDLKPYVGVQFAAIPEFPEVGSGRRPGNGRGPLRRQVG